ncbi:HupE/UreJ family protein [Nannocystaceae bacterium ST9]
MISRVRALVLALVVVLLATPALAHDFRPALLQLREVGAGQFELRLISPSSSSNGPIAEGELRPLVPDHCALTWRSSISAKLDCGERGLVGPLGLEGLDAHPVDVVVEIHWADGSDLSAVLAPADPPLLIGGVDSRSSARRFVDYLVLGIEHILLGLDHLLFVLGLVLLVRDRKTLVWTVTAFTLAHSLTLAASTLGLLTLASPPVEAGIALSILLLARELMLPEPERDTLTWRAPWLVAFGFGLLHGFGFAGALAEVGLPSQHVPLALLGFNVGVELGQLAVVVALLLVLAVGQKYARERATWTRTVVCYAMGSLAVAWLIDRVSAFGST